MVNKASCVEECLSVVEVLKITGGISFVVSILVITF